MGRNLNAIVLLSLTAALLSPGCSPHPTHRTLGADMLEPVRSDRPGAIIHTASGRRLSFDRFIEELYGSRAVLVGEVHDDAEDHLIQLQILLAMMAGPGRVNVGIEYLPWTFQAKADAYISKEISEDVFLKTSEWDRNWGYPFHLVRPIFMAARQRGAGIACLNAPREVVAKVARKGIKGLSESERSLIAEEIDLGSAEHKRYVQSAFERHPYFSPGIFDYFYEAQCAWEDTMAEKAASYLGRAEGVLVIFCGRGHIAEGFGIPERLRRRIGGRIVTVLPVKQGAAFGKEIADYVWITGGGSGAGTSANGG